MERLQLDLGVDARFRLRDLRGPHAAAPRAMRFETVHWDTHDLRLAAWDAALRHRRGRGWRVTLLTEASGSAMRRIHLDIPGPPEAPPAAALRLLSGYLRGARVAPVARLRHLESCVTLRGVLIVHRVVSRLEERRAVAQTRQVSLLLPGDPVATRRALTAVRRAGTAAPSPQPLLADLLGPEASPAWRGVGLDRGAPVSLAVAATLQDCAERLIRHQALLLEGSDPEGLHQTRVACRRYRSALQAFAPLLDRAWEEGLREELRALTDALGQVRDAEVLLARLRASAAAHGLEDSATERLLDLLAARREDGRGALLQRLRSPEHAEQLDRLLAAALRPAVLPSAADRPAAEALMPLVTASWRSLRRRLRRLGDTPGDAALHRARIATKRCRYAVLALVPVLGAEPRRAAGLLGDLQDVLGEQHDAVLAAQWLRGLTDPEVSFAAGVLFGAEREAADRGRTRWRRRWRAVDSREVWRWTRR